MTARRRHVPARLSPEARLSSTARRASCWRSRTPKAPIIAIRRRGSRGSAVTELISLIVSTYNRPDALAAMSALAFAARPTAISRSSSRTTARDRRRVTSSRVGLRRLAYRSSMSGSRIAAFVSPKFAIVRLWQAAVTILIFLDGDCIARPDFVAAHRAPRAARQFRRRQSRAAVAGADRENTQ